MKNFGLLAIALTLAINFLPSYAEDDIDQECVDFCTANNYTEGYYLAPENDDVKCKADYTQSEDGICCCK